MLFYPAVSGFFFFSSCSSSFSFVTSRHESSRFITATLSIPCSCAPNILTHLLMIIVINHASASSGLRMGETTPMLTANLFRFDTPHTPSPVSEPTLRSQILPINLQAFTTPSLQLLPCLGLPMSLGNSPDSINLCHHISTQCNLHRSPANLAMM